MDVNVEKCIQAWTNSLEQMNIKADIVFYGDSLTYYGRFSPIFPNSVVCNLGLRGDTLQGLFTRINQLKVLRPSRIFLMAGINDVANCSLFEFKGLYERLVKSISEQVDEAELVLQEMLPVNERYFSISCSNKQILLCNRSIKQIAEKYNLKCLNLFQYYCSDGELSLRKTIDGLHINQEAYKDWYELLKLL